MNVNNHIFLPKWTNKVILIAEDNDISFKYYELLLKGSGAKILRATNGQEAVDICLKNKVDIVIMDYEMPVLNGIEASFVIKKQNPQSPIILHTASENTRIEMQCRKAGCEAVLSKPTDCHEFISIVNNNISNKN